MIVVVIASLMFGSLLSPPLLLLLAVGWLLGAHAMLLIPVGVWALATVWLSANAGVRHYWKRQRFLDALTDAPLDVLDQVARLLRLQRRGLRVL
jgi:hypothetical protein